MTDGAHNPQPGGGEPSIRDQVLEQMGGWQGLVYSALPVIAFVPANSLWGLTGGAVAALAVAALVAAIRLITRSSIQPAISGFLGVAICVVIALLVGGSGKGYFLYGIVVQAILAVAFLISIVVRRPLVGVIWHLFNERTVAPEMERVRRDDQLGGMVDPTPAVAGDWRADPRTYRAFVWLTVLWCAMFTLRFVVQFVLYQNDSVGWLGVARIAMGWPMFAVGVLITFLVARRLTHDQH